MNSFNPASAPQKAFALLAGRRHHSCLHGNIVVSLGPVAALHPKTGYEELQSILVDPAIPPHLANLTKSPLGTPAANKHADWSSHAGTACLHMRCSWIDRKTVFSKTSSITASGVAATATVNPGRVFAMEISVQGCSEASQPLDTATPWKLAVPGESETWQLPQRGEAALRNRLSEQHLHLFICKHPRIRPSKMKPGHKPSQHVHFCTFSVDAKQDFTDKTPLGFKVLKTPHQPDPFSSEQPVNIF